jgi:hypothetical protein
LGPGETVGAGLKCGFRTIPYSWNGRIRTPVSAFSYTRVRGLSQLLA